MKNIYRRNRKVYAHNPDPVVTQDPPGGGERGKMMQKFSDMPKKSKVKIPSGFKVLLGNVSFDEAFAYHKSKGKSTFSYKGKKYGTQTEEEQTSMAPQELGPGGKYPEKIEELPKVEKKRRSWPKKEEAPLEQDVKTVKSKKTKTTTNIPYHMKNPYGVGGPKI